MAGYAVIAGCRGSVMMNTTAGDGGGVVTYRTNRQMRRGGVTLGGIAIVPGANNGGSVATVGVIMAQSAGATMDIHHYVRISSGIMTGCITACRRAAGGSGPTEVSG